MKLTLLLIPIILLSSCTIERTDDAITTPSIPVTQSTSVIPPPEKNIEQTTEQTSSGVIQDFGSGFTLSQTEDETLLSYSGKVVKTWSHTPPKEVPFIWDEACTIVWKGFEKLPPEDQYTGKQGVWDALTEQEKTACMKEVFTTRITIKQVTQTFFEIRELYYENYDLWLYDTKNGHLQPLPIEGEIKISETSSGVTVFLVNNFDGNDIRLIYTSDFSALVSEEKIPKK